MEILFVIIVIYLQSNPFSILKLFLLCTKKNKLNYIFVWLLALLVFSSIFYGYIFIVNLFTYCLLLLLFILPWSPFLTILG